MYKPTTENTIPADEWNTFSATEVIAPESNYIRIKVYDEIIQLVYCNDTKECEKMGPKIVTPVSLTSFKLPY